MPYNSLQLWEQFKRALKESLKEYQPGMLIEAWQSCDARTSFYTETLFPKVATKMELKQENEALFQVDFVFYKIADESYKVPIVCIESENYIGTSEREIVKLCSINAPLKVLLLCHEWTEHTKEEMCARIWQHIISSYAEVNQLVGYIGIIVAEKMETFNFHSFYFDDKAQRVDEKELLAVIEYNEQV